MFATRTSTWTRIAFLAMTCAAAAPAQAQLFPWLNPCGACPPPMAAQMVAVPMLQTASISDCPCMKPVTETVYQDVQRVEYQPVQKTVKAAKVVTVMEEQPITTYQTVTEARTVEVPSYVSQTVTEMRPVTYNQSHWQTHWQPIPKYAPCQYDPRPGLLGELNRLGYAVRNSVTPNYVARREFVPNVVTAQVPMQRVVQIPTTRQVTYNVAKVVPVTTTQKVAVQRVVWEDQTVTAMVPVTTTQRVAVGTRTRMVYSGDNGTASASNEPTPTAANPGNQSAGKDKGTTRLQSAPGSEAAPIQLPVQRRDAEPAPQPAPANGPVASQSPSVIQVAGWRATRRSTTDDALQGPELKVVQK